MKIQQLPTTQLAAAGRPAKSSAAPEESATQVKDSASLGTAEQPEKDWTVLYYLNGNNALSGQAVATMGQLEYVGSDDKMNLVTQVARPKGLLDRFSKDWSGVRRYEVIHNGKKLNPGVVIGDALTGWLPGKTKKIESPVLQDLGTEVNMGSAKTLEEFLQWGIEKFPAKHYMVVMMGPSEGLSGMQQDVIHDGKMTAPELGQAFKNVHDKTGKKIDVIAMDGSATTTAEIAYELKDHAKYLVGSQGIQAGGGFPLSMLSNELKSANGDEAQDPLTMVRYFLLMNSMGGGTISAIDLDQMGAMKEAWNGLSNALLEAKVSDEKLRTLLDNTQDFQARSKNKAYQNSRDAIHFATLVRDDKDIADPKVKAAAQAAIDAIDKALVGDAASGKYTAQAHGMSIFGPTQYGYFRPDGTPVSEDFMHDADYSNTAFAKDTAWDDVLTRAAKDSTFNNSLKKLGFSEKTIDRVHATYGQHIGKVNAALGFAGMAGWMNALNAWGGREASGFLFLGAKTAVYAGVVGAGNEALQGVKDMAYAATELKDTDEVVNKGFDVARAAAKGIANLGYVVPELKPYASTAGAFMFFSPWIRDVYGVYSEYKNVRDGIDLGIGSGRPPLEQWGAAAVKYYGDQHPRDTAERSMWQKVFG